MIAQPGWLRRLREAVNTGLTAEAAVERVQNDARAKMQRQTDPYLRERLHDLDDLANRLLHELVGQSFVADHASLPDNAIIVAHDGAGRAVGLRPLETARLGAGRRRRAEPCRHRGQILGIPAVGNVGNIINFTEQGDPIIVDGSTGHVHVRPPADVENSSAEKARLRAKRQEQYRKLRDVPCLTRDGVPIDLHMNAGLVVDLPHMEETGAVSIGLFRTEIQFMVAHRFPRVRERKLLCRAILERVATRRVASRTWIGDDKVLPYMDKVEEENPALGWRAIRIGLDRPALLRSSCAPCSGPVAAATSKSCPDDRRWRNFTRPRPLRSRKSLISDVTDTPCPTICSWGSCWKSRRCSGSSTKSAPRWISYRSAPTISCNISSPSTAIIRESRTA